MSVEVFVPADPRWTRPYLRVARPSGGADWYCWATESGGGGGWVHIAGPPLFDLRDITTEIAGIDAAQPGPRADGGGA